MSYDPYSILEVDGACFVALWFFGFLALFTASRRARLEFRTKGYLKTPYGKHWFPFLMYKHYDAFDDHWTRVLFSIAHGCMMGMMVSAAAAAALIGCVVMLTKMASVPGLGN